MHTAYFSPVAPSSIFQELLTLLRRAQVEVRIETFKQPPDRAGGLCSIQGSRLVLLHAGATRAEQTQALLEVFESIGLDALGLTGAQLSPELLRRLNRRGHMPWPHPSEAPRVARALPHWDEE